MHTHVCGYDPDYHDWRHDLITGQTTLDRGAGCGHRWSHGDGNQNKAEAHICPECGRGPWYVRAPEKVR